MSKGLALAIVAMSPMLGLAACSAGGDDAPPLPSAPTPAERLAKETGTSWRVDVDPVTGAPDMVLAVDPIAPSAGNGVSFDQAARAFLEAHADMWRLTDTKNELALEEVLVSGDRAAHVRFVQLEGGLRVDGAFLAVHFRSDGSIGGVQGVLAPDARSAVSSPALDATRAQAAALAEVASEVDGFDASWLDAQPAASLLLVPSGAGAVLAWRVSLAATTAKAPQALRYVVDVEAKTGAILASWDTIEHTTATGIGLRGDKKTFEITQVNPWVSTWYALVREGNASHTRLETYDYDGGDPLYVATFDKDRWEDGVTRGKGAGVDAFVYVGLADRYFRDRHGWSGFDGHATPIPITVHENAGPYAGNASYDKGAIHVSDAMPFAAGLDTLAHEFTHGVTAANSGLRNYGQPGAINEAISDIFGTMVENDNDAPLKNLEVYGDAYRPGGDRELAHPKSLAHPGVDHMSDLRDDGCKPRGSNDNCSVHANSTIASNAWWLMTFGGTNDTSKVPVKNPLGLERSRAVWWSTERLLLGPTTNFDRLGRWQTMNAFLYHRPHEPVACAWVATGVLTPKYVKETYGVTCYCELPDGGVDETCGDAGAPPAGDAGAGGADGSGSGTTAEPELFDSCKGRADGVYCSTLASYSAIVCKGEVIAGGQQCAGSAACTGPNGPGATIACEGQAAPPPSGGPAGDSCAGRADGMYCSTAAPYSAFICKNGSIAGGQQCATGTCVGPNGPGDTIACK